MSIGGGIALIVIGAILTFALNFEVEWINLDLVGYIFMAAGLVILIIGLVFLLRRRQSVSTTRTGIDPANGQQVTQRRSESDDPLR
ncbi:LPXTG cell wall anchor domain-containing protein [Herbiconiux daphne]|uniref:LPXTG cell wall anchor domain-containing protein n=1 Tax=Herbiconiux daphne TaxID=2970914 RepID=A0ABT2H0G2_9MICO|nr:LPXTG cell wall anchor domain-containing protein [Herbiconiux daphne]MCS5733004.1 LPXTG cell wall anchor domain-containing protein [Herbiconiux daphne]